MNINAKQETKKKKNAAFNLYILLSFEINSKNQGAIFFQDAFRIFFRHVLVYLKKIAQMFVLINSFIW